MPSPEKGAANIAKRRAWWRRSAPEPGLAPARFPLGAAFGLTATLLALAVGTTWLLQRDAARETRARSISIARSDAELIAQATAEADVLADHARLTRILECTARSGDITAGAILDPAGKVIAHTDVSRLDQVVSLPPAEDFARSSPPGLFSGTGGQAVVQPVLDADGLRGFVVLRLADRSPKLFDHEALRILLPAFLLLLAFAGVILATIRWAVRPTADFLARLTCAIEAESPPETAAAREEPREAIDRAVRCVDALQQEKRALLLQTRLLGYEKKRFAGILEHLPDGLLVADAAGKLAFVNRAALRLMRLATDGPSPTGTAELPASFAQAMKEARRVGQAEATGPDDGARIRVTRVPVSAREGEPEGDIFLFQDDTAREAAQRAQAEFLSQISHELKAPLNTIVTYIEALAEGEELEPEERKSYFNTLNEEALRMARLISNLMQLSRIQLGNLSANFGFVKPAGLILQQTEALRAQAEGRGQVLEAHVPENLPALYGDKDLLGVALSNLLSNALKYTPAGGRITVRATSEDAGVRIEIADTGIGIPADEQERVFERFARSPQPEVQAQAGSGLGLALVREIAEIHEGNIRLTSELGRGSVFRLWLPVREVGTRLDLAAA